MADSPPEPNEVLDLSPTDVRARLVHALNYDLVGPGPEGFRAEERMYPNRFPSNEYLMGFLAPAGASPDARQGDEDDDMEEIPAREGEETAEERKAAKRSFFPSSMGLSFLLPPDANELELRVSWGDYERVVETHQEETSEEGEVSAEDSEKHPKRYWQRLPRTESFAWVVPNSSTQQVRIDVPDSEGLKIVAVVRDLPESARTAQMADGTKSVAMFVVNERVSKEGRDRDADFAFQAKLEVGSRAGFCARPDLRGRRAGGFEEHVAELHFADANEFAVGHGVSADWELLDGACSRIWTCWIPQATVEKVVTAQLDGLQLSMNRLGALESGTAAKQVLLPLVEKYRAWIEAQRAQSAGMKERHRVVAEELLRSAEDAADRIESGIEAIAEDDQALAAFSAANRAVSRALKKRLKVDSPNWRAFQLAFLLLNLRGMVEESHSDREEVDLLFFPTGGGKTEAYLGLAAFAMVLRRLRNPGLTGAGVSVIMRYTLRLLTLDQLGRAAALVCALELEREVDSDVLGEWPFEIGLWVGRAATPNRMGKKGDDRNCAREKVRHFKNNPQGRPSPIPLEECPWCGSRFTPDSFELTPNDDAPSQLLVRCVALDCEFSGGAGRALPLVAVDEPLYRRLPAFLIATVDKFASLPWVAESGMLLGGATKYGVDGFYGAGSRKRGTKLDSPLLPPDLIIQDELHLISGPLGTISGLYEAAIEGLCQRSSSTGQAIKPKIVASTATAKQAGRQIQALFGRASTSLFPPQGPSRRDSFFAQSRTTEEVPGRQYLGISAQGRNPKTIMKRVWLALMGAAEKAYREAGGEANDDNPADAYMTIVGYFNSLKELGGSRRLLEEEIHHSARGYGARKAMDEDKGLFVDRPIVKDIPVELTSRVSTDKVAEAKRRLSTRYSDVQNRIDSAIATNMISVGLDITRLGLMVVQRQPKTHSEYIQATSRVGRNEKLGPGLVIVLLGAHQPRDRSHYEKFRHYHATFYRDVEVSSVTPFSARALDRALVGAMVSYARHARIELTPPAGVAQIQSVRIELQQELERIFRVRAENQGISPEGGELDEVLHSVSNRIGDLLDSWEFVIREAEKNATKMQYQKYELKEGAPLLRDMLDSGFATEHHRKFRVNRSMRGVEPAVNLFRKSLSQEAE
jgi:hypothetical protein